MSRIIILLVRLYQITISRILPRTCRFTPSCSQYTIDAMKDHGLIKGTILSIYRILRCQPLCAGGWDPVPPKGLDLMNILKNRHLCKDTNDE